MDQVSEHRPIVCRLDVFNSEEANRHQALWEAVQDQAQGLEDHAEGYAINFPAEDALLVSIAELVTFERRCCPFLDFNIELRPAAGKMRLRLSGGAGVKDFLGLELSGLFAGS